MTFESFENILSLFCTIAGLLYCVFKYVETPKRGYRYLVVFFLANFLSEYYWTVYELIMRSSPDVSGFAAYLGWNVAYFVLLCGEYFIRHEESRKYFHPVILLPVLINIPQFLLYISYGAVLNNIWEVGTTTLTMVFCLQEIMYWLKHRDKVKAVPLFSVLVLAFMITQYGMWTASCFDFRSQILNPYFYCSVINSLISIFFGYGVKRYYEAEESESPAINTSDLRFKVLTQSIVSILIIAVCAAGFFSAFRLKESMSDGGFIRDEKQIVVHLFAMSALLIVIVLALLLYMTSNYRKTRESVRRMSANDRGRLNFYVTIGVTLVLMILTVIYNNNVLYNASVVGVYEDAEAEIKTIATDLENYLGVAETTVRVAADSVDLMEQHGRPIDEIERFIMSQTTLQSEEFDENFTGIYAYINGEYLDGLGWVPPEDYEPTERDWYKAVVAADGKVVIVPPYVDAQTGSVVITIGKKITGGDAAYPNVVCLDVIVNHIQEVTEEVEIAGKGYGMAVNKDGFIVAHHNAELNGQNVSDVYGPELMDSILSVGNGRTTAYVDGENSTVFVAPVMDQWYSVIVIGNTELFEDTWSQLAVNIMASLVTFFLISFFYYIGYKNEQIYGIRVEQLNLQVVTALASAIDAKDTYTNGHSTRVAEYSKMIAGRGGFSKSEQDEIYMMGLLHDVGKIGVPDSVINKPSRLTDEEYELIKKHPVIGDEILSSIKERPKLRVGARWHHERYGGGGYPDGLVGEQIPIEARIIAVADAYDAMTSRRRYRDVMSQDKVRSEIEKGKGSQFDPRFADIMIEMIDEDTDYTMRE